MLKSIQLHMLPLLVHPHELAGNTVVVIDVLRASTTICHALAAGAERIIPCLEVAEARNLARQHHRSLLGGERGGEPIDGFNLGNSPAEYVEAVVGGKIVVFTTTNGTQAMMRCVGAAEILIGAFVNLAALCDCLQTCPSVHLVCAGTNGEITREDVLFGGAVVDKLLDRPGAGQLNDSARLAHNAWRNYCGGERSLAETLSDSRGGANLLALGRRADIEVAAKLDEVDVVPRLDQSDWSIRSLS